MIALPTILGSKQIPVQISNLCDLPRHKLQMALAPGDVIVLATNYTDENNKRRKTLYPVDLIYVDSIDHRANKITWRMRTDDCNAGENLFSHDLLDIYITQPVKTVCNHKGVCTLFTIEIEHGYRVHFLDFVKNRLPEIYVQLNIS